MARCGVTEAYIADWIASTIDIIIQLNYYKPSRRTMRRPSPRSTVGKARCRGSRSCGAATDRTNACAGLGRRSKLGDPRVPGGPLRRLKRLCCGGLAGPASLAGAAWRCGRRRAAGVRSCVAGAGLFAAASARRPSTSSSDAQGAERQEALLVVFERIQEELENVTLQEALLRLRQSAPGQWRRSSAQSRAGRHCAATAARRRALRRTQTQATTG